MRNATHHIFFRYADDGYAGDRACPHENGLSMLIHPPHGADTHCRLLAYSTIPVR
jgi:nitrite reductase/ring-hydroxylating ferredoxin subunit